MSLQTRLSELITAIGADIKALQASSGKTPNQLNGSVSSQGLGTTDAIVVGSVVPIPTGKLQPGTIYRVKLAVTKTAAGVATPIINVRVGTAGTTADASRATLTFAAQTAVADDGEFEVICVFRTVSNLNTILQALGKLTHRLVTTGLNVTATNTWIRQTTPAGFDGTAANLKISLSINPGASSSWTIDVVTAELLNLA